MCACNVETIKLISKYLNSPVGTVCFNTAKVLTSVINKQNVEGFATIVLKLVSQIDKSMPREQYLLCYQWLEYFAMYANQAAINPIFAKSFLKELNKALEVNSYLVGQSLSVADVAAFYVLYPLLERLTVIEKESFLHLCRWSKHIQAQPRVCSHRPPLLLNALSLTVLAPAVH